MEIPGIIKLIPPTQGFHQDFKPGAGNEASSHSCSLYIIENNEYEKSGDDFIVIIPLSADNTLREFAINLFVLTSPDFSKNTAIFLLSVNYLYQW